jgi:lysophospholipase L1-like esterase
MNPKKNSQGRSTVFGVTVLFFSVLALAILNAAVNATNPYAVKVTDTNGNLTTAGTISDAWPNYPSVQSSLSNSYFQTNTVPPMTGVYGTYLSSAYAYFIPAFNTGSMGITIAQLHQALQVWFGHPGTDAADFPYTPTYVSLKGIKRAVFMGDSLTVGTGSTPVTVGTNIYEEGPGAGNWVDQLGEGYSNWAPICMVNQGHGGLALSPYLSNDFRSDILPYAPVGSEKVYLLICAGTNDILLSGATGVSLLSAMTSYVTIAHSYGFYVVLMNIPNAEVAAGTGVSFTGTEDGYRQYYNTNMASCGADVDVDVATLLSSNVAYAASATNGGNPHYNDLGYSNWAQLVNAAVPNP